MLTKTAVVPREAYVINKGMYKHSHICGSIHLYFRNGLGTQDTKLHNFDYITFLRSSNCKQEMLMER